MIDAAPLICAAELGYFSDEGLDVVLERQIGWGNVRDKLTYGRLHASQVVLGMPLMSHLGEAQFAEPLLSVMGLGSGGNAITVSRSLFDAGVESADSLFQWLNASSSGRPRAGRTRLSLAHVFSCSMHHYLLRRWLSSATIDADRDVRLCVVPPPLMARHLEQHFIDAMCVGEPWNTVAMRNGSGQIACATTDIIPAHPEKVLAVGRRWARHNTKLVGGLVRATLRGCIFANRPDNRGRVSELLARPEYLALPVETVYESVAADQSFGRTSRKPRQRPRDWELRSFAPERMFPSQTHAAWLGMEMRRCGHIPEASDLPLIAAECTDGQWFRAAAAPLGIACPNTEAPPMQVLGGTFELTGVTTDLAEVP